MFLLESAFGPCLRKGPPQTDWLVKQGDRRTEARWIEARGTEARGTEAMGD